MGAHKISPNTIYAGEQLTDSGGLREASELDGLPTVILDFKLINSTEDFYRVLGDSFRFPYAVANADAALDLMVAPEEFEPGLVLIVDANSTSQLDLLLLLVGLLPDLVDRWRTSGGELFVFISKNPYSKSVISALDRSNDALRAAPSWADDVQPVPIVEARI